MRCVSLLSGTDICVAAVAGFPLGATLSEVKAFEAQQMVEAGAREIDMVINIGALKGRDYALVGPGVGVKAAGGIKTFADALAMITAGANRIGASASVRIIQEAEQADTA
jgi:deoxyribose-phosphate aldolase